MSAASGVLVAPALQRHTTRRRRLYVRPAPASPPGTCAPSTPSRHPSRTPFYATRCHLSRLLSPLRARQHTKLHRQKHDLAHSCTPFSPATTNPHTRLAPRALQPHRPTVHKAWWRENSPMSAISSIFVLPPAGHDLRRGASNLFVEGPRAPISAPTWRRKLGKRHISCRQLPSPLKHRYRIHLYDKRLPL